MASSWFCSAGASGLPKDLATAAGLKDKTVLECDYDDNVTNLYSAIESEAWVAVMQFLETGQWEHMFLRDPLSPSRQARTWVTRFNPDGTVRWSQLPLHAALIFGAPKKLILKLVDLYPLGVRCTDDQQMLPLHLAMKFGTDDAILAMLLDKFPAALSTKDVRGRIPIDIEGPDKSKERMQVLRKVVTVTTDTIRDSQGKYYKQKMKDLQDDIAVQAKRVAELEAEKNELEAKLKRNTTDFAELQEDFDAFREAMLHSKARTQYDSSDSLEPQRQKQKSSSPPATDPEHESEGRQQHPPSRPPPVTASKQMHREMVMKPSSSFDSCSTGSRSRLMQSPRSFVFGRSKDYSGSIDAPEEQRELAKSADSSKRGSWTRGKSTPPPTIVGSSNNDTNTNNNTNSSVSSQTTNTATAPRNMKRVEKQQKQQRKDKKKYMWSKTSQRGNSWVKATTAAIDSMKGRKPPRPGGDPIDAGTNVADDDRGDVDEQRERSTGSTQRVSDSNSNNADDQEMIVSSTPYNRHKIIGQKLPVPVPHPGTRPRLSRRGFFRGFDNDATAAAEQQ